MPGLQKIFNKAEVMDYIIHNFDIESSESMGRRWGVSGQRIRAIAKELGLKRPQRNIRQLKSEVLRLKLKLAKYENPQHNGIA